MKKENDKIKKKGDERDQRKKFFYSTQRSGVSLTNRIEWKEASKGQRAANLLKTTHITLHLIGGDELINNVMRLIV